MGIKQDSVSVNRQIFFARGNYALNTAKPLTPESHMTTITRQCPDKIHNKLKSQLLIGFL